MPLYKKAVAALAALNSLCCGELAMVCPLHRTSGERTNTKPIKLIPDHHNPAVTGCGGLRGYGTGRKRTMLKNGPQELTEGYGKASKSIVYTKKVGPHWYIFINLSLPTNFEKTP